jgi:hypothetical protein
LWGLKSTGNDVAGIVDAVLLQAVVLGGRWPISAMLSNQNCANLVGYRTCKLRHNSATPRRLFNLFIIVDAPGDDSSSYAHDNFNTRSFLYPIARDVARCAEQASSSGSPGASPPGQLVMIADSTYLILS